MSHDAIEESTTAPRLPLVKQHIPLDTGPVAASTIFRTTATDVFSMGQIPGVALPLLF